LTSEFSTQRSQTKLRCNRGDDPESQKSHTDGDKKGTPLPRHLDQIADDQN